MRTIRGKKTLVTGAASGIGRSLTLRLAGEGADLFLVDKDEPGLAAVAEEARRHGVEVVCHVCDVSQPAAVAAAVHKLVDTWATLDILVNNAGICFYGPTDKMTAEQWDRMLAVNLLAPVQFIRQLLPLLLARHEAHIVNLASFYGLFATNRATAYHTTKFAMVGLSESLRAEYSRQGLGVTAVCPGFVRTNLYAAMDVAARRPKLPKWICTSPERVAARIVRGIYRDQRLVVITPLAHLAYFVRRLAPGLLDRLYRIGRRRKMRQKAALLASRAAAAKQQSPSKQAA